MFYEVHNIKLSRTLTTDLQLTMTRCKRQDIVNATNCREHDLSYEATIFTSR